MVVVEGCFSNWWLVIHGVLLGPVQIPLLFVIYINDLNDNIVNMLNEFADDTKSDSIMDSEEGYFRLHCNLL